MGHPAGEGLVAGDEQDVGWFVWVGGGDLEGLLGSDWEYAAQANLCGLTVVGE